MSFPFYARQFTFTQPDGTQLEVVGWGDQNGAVFEAVDGYTVVRDPMTGFYQYAALTPGGDELRPTGLRAGHGDPGQLGLKPGLRASPSAAKVLAMAADLLPKSKWKERIERRKMLAHASELAAGAPAPPASHTLGDMKGLCLLIQFPDVAGTISQQEVEQFCNGAAYRGFGNNGSVFEYYRDNSAGKLRYTTVVAPYYTTQHPRDYYTDPSIPFGQRARDLVQEALAHHKATGFDFSGLATDPAGNVYATNVFYAGPRVNNWSEGLWPHSSRLGDPVEVAPNTSALDYQVTNMGQALELGTYCHENGHMLCDFPDLNEYASQASGVGRYCLMCLGGNADPTNPTQICGYLKFSAGWSNPVTAVVNGLHAQAPAGSNAFFISKRSATEYFLLENRNNTGRDAALPGSGLAIWHVDELGSNSNPESAPAGHQHFECSLEQADGRDDLGVGQNDGDATDLFRSGLNNRFDRASKPACVWWDGTPASLDVHDIGNPGATIDFSADV